MKSAIIFIIGLVVGGIIGVIGGGLLGTGVGAGAGVITGLQSGACLTLEAAREKGLITAGQEAELWQAALEQLAGTELPASAMADRGEIDCAKVVSELKAGQ